jgi:uroporphyrin-III C-methyltransferase/precorrin-2 dehydrogenase/sirohydrochlorin ferrochelatase
VVGGGRIGTRKALTLLEHGADVSVMAPVLASRLLRESFAGRVKWLNREFVPGSTRGFRLVVAATDSPQTNAAIAGEALLGGVPCCNVSDRRGTAVVFPATRTVGDATLAVHTGGRDCRRSVDLCKVAANALSHTQRLPRRATPGRMPLTVVAAGSSPPDGLGPGIEGVSPRLRAGARPACGPAGRPGTVFLVGAGPGASDLVTLRGLRALMAADVIVQDELLPDDYLSRLPVDLGHVRVVRLGGKGTRESQGEIGRMLTRLAAAGNTVVRLKGGDPGVLARLEDELSVLARSGIPAEVVPGATVGTAAPAAAFLPLTRRERGRSFAVATVRAAGGATVRDLPRADTLMLYMGVHAAARVRALLVRSGWSLRTPCRIFERATQLFERRLDTCLRDLPRISAAMAVGSPALLLIGAGADRIPGSAPLPRILFFGDSPAPYRCLGHVLHWPAFHPELPPVLAPAEVALFERPEEVDAIVSRFGTARLPATTWCAGPDTLARAVGAGLNASALVTSVEQPRILPDGQLLAGSGRAPGRTRRD